MASNNQEPPGILLNDGDTGVRVLSPSPGVKRRSLRNRRSDAMHDLPPSMRVRFILGEDADKPGQNEPRPIFSEMEEFKSEDGTTDGEWKEVARWIKFEEDVEDGGNRWTKPFVGTLSLHALFEFRSALLNGTLMLEAEATTVEEVVKVIVDKVCSTHQLTAEQKSQMMEVMSCPHRHLYEVQKSAPLLMSEKNRNSSAKNLTESRSKVGLALPSVPSMTNAANAAKGNSPFMKKIPPGAEVNNVLVGEVDFLEKPVSAFVRLSKATILGDFAEVRLPSRFVFLLLGPKGQLEDYREVGRVVATLMSDEVFNAVAYRAKNRDHLLAGIDEFMDAVTILPPGEWDPSIRIDPPTSVPSQEPRKNPDKPPEEKEDPALEELKVLESQGLVRTGRIFGGLIDDVKRKLPFYKSDFTDAFAVQSIASITFLYFASLSPIITFGGLLGDATENRLAALESLCAGCICGIIYSLFAGQPLALLNATGPVLVFEGILYSFCSKNGYDYLSLRAWVGVWMGVFMITLCAFEISAWVAFITRFTEENFALLIATIYVYKAIEKIIYIGIEYPLFPPEPKLNATDCYCYPSNDTLSYAQGALGEMGPYNWTGLPTNSCAEMWNGTLMGEDCFPKQWYPNVFLMSVLLSVFTYSVCVTLKGMKHTLYFPYKIRCLISDFAVFIAICSMTGLDYYAGVRTPKLHVPSDFKPTWSGRGWIVNPIHPDNPWWIIPGAMLPAALATILLFLDQQITAVIVNRKENKLKKGCGYHLDLFVLAILTALMGLMGLPWHVAGTVICINHVNSLKQESETAAPGEKPVFLGVREQRVTHLVIFLLVGLSVFMTPILKYIPMPVLYGVFLYMGTAPLSEMHFFDRLRIVFMPAKYQPDFNYLRKVPLKRVHMYTAIQLACFAILWVVKTNETISISFPLMLVIMIFIRKSLDFVFTREELHVLDAVIPPFRRSKKPPQVESGTKSVVNGKGQSYSALPKNSSKVNISDEVARSGAWLHVNNSKAALQDGTEMISYRRKDYGDAKVSDDESEPLTFLSGTKRIQIQPGTKHNQ